MVDPKPLTATMFLITVTGAVALKPADAQTLPADAPIPFATYDRDDDGFISEPEFGAFPANHAPVPAGGLNFDLLDRNNDKRLSAAEYAAGLRARTQRRRSLRLRREPGGDEEMEQEMGK